jgi:AraC-like DNA-binding protein
MPAFIHLLEASAKAAKIDNFGLRLSEKRRLSNLGPVGLMAREQATVREGIQALANYMGLHSDGISLRVEERDDLVVIRPVVSNRRSIPMRQATELSVGVVYRTLRLFLGDVWKPKVITFSHGPPKDLGTHQRILGSRIEFGDDLSAVVCGVRDLEKPIPSSDPVMVRYIRQYLETIAGQQNTTTSDKVREFVWMLLPAGRCSIEQIAEHMGVDRRTVHRRLVSEETTFSSIVDSVRTEMAVRYLEDPNRPLYLISHMLGFSALSAFSRWFRNQYKCSASQWRTEALKMSEPSGKAHR